MDKNKKEYSELTDASSGYAFLVSVPESEAEQTNANIIKARQLYDTNKAKAVRQCLADNTGEMEARQRIKHALDILDGAYDLEDLDFMKEAKMALLGCPTTTATEFTGELSPEYKARYKDE